MRGLSGSYTLEDFPDSDPGLPGVEIGSYEYNEQTGELNVTYVYADENGDAGLADDRVVDPENSVLR